MQGQALADFLVEYTFPETLDDNAKSQISIHSPLTCILNFYGSTGTEHKGAGLVLKDPEGHQFACAIKFTFHVSNS